MKEFTDAARVAASKTITEPRWLIEFSLVPIIRLSSGTTIHWQSVLWPLGRFTISGLAESTDFNDRVTIKLLNTEVEYTGAMLAGGVVGKRIRIWQFWKGATSDDDPIERFDGVGKSLELTEDGLTVSGQMYGMKTQYSPRQRVSSLAGFRHLSPSGQKIAFGNETYILMSREDG